jgi:hypothetical protein
MVFDPTDFDRRAVQFVAGACKIGVEVLTEFAVSEKSLAVLRREHNVQVNLSDGLRHGIGPRCRPCEIERNLYNAFGVSVPNNPVPRVRRCAATLGFAV